MKINKDLKRIFEICNEVPERLETLIRMLETMVILTDDLNSFLKIVGLELRFDINVELRKIKKEEKKIGN